MENRGRKIGWKTVFSTKEGKPERKFSLPGPQFSSSQIGRKRLETKVLSQHFYTNALFLSHLTATNTTIFLSNNSKLKHNQIIRIQTQKHNFKINQIITHTHTQKQKQKNKNKKKTKKKERKKTKDRSHLTHLDCVGDDCSGIK